MGYSARLHAYYRLSKPGIIYANILTAAAGFLFASRDGIAWLTLVSLIAGTALVIGGACAFNNYLDRSIDAKMKRTSRRSIVTGAIRGQHALLFASVLTAFGLMIIAVTQNILTLGLITIALVDYVILYGYTKRTSVHGTLVGCISGSIPLVAGYTAVTGSFDVTAGLLFALMVAWQMAHFYGIALFRLKDYKAASIPVMPAIYGARSTQLQSLGYIMLFILISIIMVGLDKLGVLPGLILIGFGMVWLFRSLRAYGSVSAIVWGRQMFMFSLIVLLGMVGLLSIDPLLV